MDILGRINDARFLESFRYLRIAKVNEEFVTDFL